MGHLMLSEHLLYSGKMSAAVSLPVRNSTLNLLSIVSIQCVSFILSVVPHNGLKKVASDCTTMHRSTVCR